MAAYVYGDIEITDPAGYAAYRAEVPATIARFGGRFLVRGGDATVLEGARTPRRQVLLEFPDMAALRTWYDSPEYLRLREMRQQCSIGDLIALEGVPPAV